MSRHIIGNYGKATLAFLLTLTLLISVAATFQIVYAQSSDYYHMTYSWNYQGYWTWNLDIPKALYDAYKSVSEYTRIQNGIQGYGFLVTTHDSYIQSLTDKLTQISDENGFSEYEKVSFALAFVQSLPYTSDDVTTLWDEYPRFPIETLVDNGGDCEDTSILFATIVKQMGYGVVFINPEGHYAVGVLGEDTLEGYYWTYPTGSDNRYYYCETTGNGFEIGELPDDYIGEKAHIYPIYENQQYEPNIQIQPTDEPLPTAEPTGTSTTQPTNTHPQDTTSEPDDFFFSFMDDLGMFILEIGLIFIVVIVIVAVAVSKTRSTQPPPPPPTI
ncbi:MAG: hypothetical protein NWF01_02070 [Candidatus Bathyarchaeota archaeon]|nr:hypothetical protein [Candidatus Bathyarchaeota archaeon]